MKNILDEGIKKKNPGLVKHIFLLVIERRKKQTVINIGKKPIKVIPVKVHQSKTTRRNGKLNNAI